MVWKVKRVQCGGPMDQHDGLWLDGHTTSNPEFSGRTLEFKFKLRRNILAKHLHIFWQCGTVEDSNNYQYIINRSYMKLLSVLFTGHRCSCHCHCFLSHLVATVAS